MEIPEGYANVRLKFRCNGITDEMGCSVQLLNSSAQGVEFLAQNVAESWEQNFFPTASGILSDWVFVGADATLMTSGGPVVGSHNMNIQGTGSAPGCTVNIALLVRKNTSLGGRKNRGRLYYPPADLEESIVSTAGIVTPSEVISYQGAFDQFFDDMEVTQTPLMLLHSDPLAMPTPMTGFTVQPQVATQRRRLR